MKKVILKFPSIVTFLQFIRCHKVQQGIVDDVNYTVMASLPETLVDIACREYGAGKESLVYL
jgi:hypothetical protein